MHRLFPVRLYGWGAVATYKNQIPVQSKTHRYTATVTSRNVTNADLQFAGQRLQAAIAAQEAADRNLAIQNMNRPRNINTFCNKIGNSTFCNSNVF
ncbi:hypothetical protein [Neisseria perflava]|uniref:hypothetical protein n=1 Tax=Neisseria perflava TaxID=33053 RepID=UPI00209D05AB|nr:hypothetical protein [Neisseria perflava]MCP1659996.1 hypothetical protein [Neisseria perflava]MCP1771987.1 hypothetical protein [Neisseria perflava]